MPAKSEKQRRLMEAAAHDPKAAKQAGIRPAQARRVLGKHGTRKRPKPRKRMYSGATLRRLAAVY